MNRWKAAILVAASLFVAGACRGSNTPVNPSPSASNQLATPNATRATPDQNEPPSRDVIDLARRFRGLSPDAPRLARDAPYGYQVGDHRDFNVIDLENPHIVTVGGRVVAVTDHAYFFAQDGLEVSDSALSRITSDFESIVYPRVTGAFGQEWTPGVDSDTRITLLHADLRGAAGYFSDTDEYPAAIVPRSNESEILYLDANALKSPGDSYNTLVGHELQHLIHWKADAGEEAWVNEGLSQVAAEIVHGGNLSRVSEFLASPDTQLNFWPALGQSGIHYAESELFFGYLLDHYGGRGNAKQLLAAQDDGVEGVNQYLAPFGVTFEDVFADWVIANRVDEPEGRYANLSTDAKVTVATTIRELSNGEGTVHQLAADYLDIEPPTPGATLTIDGSRTVGVGVPAPPGGGAFWWSERGDSIDSRLTRGLDLTGLTKATLKFSAWYDTEKDWDYAYVAVSTDGGKTWMALPGSHTTPDDPVEIAYGPGYTGKSADWQAEEVDLSAYVGKRILARFEYVTDDATSLTGFAVSNIQVPELGPADDGSWTGEGFQRVGRPLEQKFIVQVIQGSDPAQVRRVEMNAENQVDIKLDGPATVVVAAVTEGTAEEASYTWSLRAP